MSDITRREAVQAIAAATAIVWAPNEVERARRLTDFAEEQATQGAAQAFKPKFFNAHEYETVKMLGDMIIPRDDRSAARQTRACRSSWTSF